MMKPSDESESDDLLETDDTSNQEDDDDTSVGSEDAEEKAYLRSIEESTTPHVVLDITAYLRTTPKQYQLRPESAASIQTMVTVPTTPQQFPTQDLPPLQLALQPE
jgi:hypothetical protein